MATATPPSRFSMVNQHRASGRCRACARTCLARAAAHVLRALAHRAKIQPEPGQGGQQRGQAGRCRRQASTERAVERRGRLAATRPLGSAPAPRSRRIGEPAAAASRTPGEGGEQAEQPPVVAVRTAASGSPSRSARASRPGAEATVPPASTPPSMLPTPRRGKATASTAVASPVAPRAERESCAVSAATPVKAAPTAATEAPAAKDLRHGLAGRDHRQPEQRRQRGVRAERHDHRAVRPAAGPTTPAPRSSARPASSVLRTACAAPRRARS